MGSLVAWDGRVATSLGFSWIRSWRENGWSCCERSFPRLKSWASSGIREPVAQLAGVKAAAQGIAVKLLVLEIRNAVDLDVALGAGLNGGAYALVVLSSPVVSASVNSKRIAVFATSNRLPPSRHSGVCGGGRPYVLWSNHS